jgi:hypothetical protein
MIKKSTIGAYRVAHVVKWLPSKHKAQSSNPRLPKEKKKTTIGSDSPPSKIKTR